MIDESSLPLDREGRERWLAAREEHVASITRAALRRIVGQAVDAFQNSLTAAGDLAAFDKIPGAWLTVVEGEIAPALTETFQAGQVTAWLGLKKQPTKTYAAGWGQIANQNAVSYMQGATNRLTGVGNDMWKQVRSKAQSAVSKGLTNEELKGEIEKVTGFTEYRADTIARTETIGAYVQGDLAGARALGDSGPVEKVWVAALDARTRPSHEAAHDTCIPIDEMFDIGGEQMDAPHDPNADAGEVVNCRCYLEMLYPGDTRPDGTVIEMPEEEEVTEEEYEPSEIDPTEFTPTSAGSSIVTARDGSTFRFTDSLKPGAQRAHVARSDLADRAGIRTARTRATTLDGRRGIVVEEFPSARSAFPGSNASFDPTRLTDFDIDDIQRNRVLDHLLGGKSDPIHFVRQGYASSGARITSTGARFEGSFRSLSLTKNNAAEMIDGAWAEGKALASNGRAARNAAIKALQEVPDRELRAMFQAHADELFTSKKAAARYLDDLVARKNSLADDFAKYDKTVDKARATATATPVPKQIPLDGSKGGPKGMSGAPQSQVDTTWMRKNDSPLTSRASAPQAYNYTAGSGGYNGPARAGTVTKAMKDLDAELGTIKSDMIVHRGVRLESYAPPGGMPALQGQVLLDNAYVSTSAGGRAAFSGDTYLTIRANAGTPGSWVKPISAFSHENEMLLGRDLPMYVHSVTRQGSSWIVELETVSKEWVAENGMKTWNTAKKAWV